MDNSSRPAKRQAARPTVPFTGSCAPLAQKGGSVKKTVRPSKSWKARLSALKSWRPSAALKAGALFGLICCISLHMTWSFIHVPGPIQQQEQQKVQAKPLPDNESLNTSELSAGNLLQHYENSLDFGLAVSTNKYLFRYQERNGRGSLNRTDLATGQTKPVLSGYPVKGLQIVADRLYMVMEEKDDQGNYSQVIAYSSIEDFSITPVTTTRAPFITSFTSDGENLYYTVNGEYIIYRCDSNNAIEKMYETDNKGVTPHILGIRQGRLYYVNGQYMASLGLNSRKNTIITTQYASVEQYPIMTEEGIIAFYNLARTRVDRIDYEGKFQQTVVNEQNIAAMNDGRLRSLNYASGHLFMATKNKVWVTTATQGTPAQVVDVTATTEQIYVGNDVLVSETSPGQGQKITNIVYLLAA